MNRSPQAESSAPAARLPAVLRAFLTSALLCLSSPLPSEELRLDRIEHLTVEDGLAHNNVRDVQQDHLGFLWIATGNGLQRYDGYELRTYRHDPDDPDTLSVSRVRTIFEDSQGVLWLSTPDGLNRFDRAQERFDRFRHDPDDDASLADNNLRVVYEDSSGTLWIGGEAALHRFDRRTQTLQRYVHDPDDPGSLNAGNVHAILEDRHGQLWVGTQRGLYRFEPEPGTAGGGSFVRYAHTPSDPASLAHDIVRALHEDRQGRLWIGTEGGLDRFDVESGTFVHHSFEATEPPGRSPDLVRAIHEDRGGALWIGTESGGLVRRDPATGRFARYFHDPDHPSGLSSDSIRGVHEDRTGVLWVGTQSGLEKIDPRRERFAVFRHGTNGAAGLAGRRVWGMAYDRSGVLWVATRDGGLTALDRGRETAVHYRPEPGDENSLIHPNVADVAEDPAGNLWIGTAGGLSRLGPDRRRFVHYRHDPENLQSLRSDKIYSLMADSAGSIWIATRSTGIQRIDRPPGEPERFVTYLHDPTNERSLGANEVYGFYEDRAGEVWLGTVSGINRFDRATDGFERLAHDPANSDSVSSNDVTVIYEDADGVFWIGTLGGGLNRWDRARGTFRHFRVKDGLPSDNVESILADDRGHLWLASSHALSRFDPATETFSNYDVSDGLHGRSFAIGSACRGLDGELYFGGDGGITAFHPDHIEDDRQTPAVVLTRFSLAGQPVRLRRLDADSPLAESVTSAREIVLNHRQKVFTFEFAALHFAQPRHNRYAYQLEGFDPEWIETGADKRFAHYTNLDARDYVFRVKAGNKDGAWNDEGATIRVVVRPPPWRTWWAYSLYALALAVVALGYVRSHRKELRREREVSRRLREVDKLKDQFLANTSHELRTPLYGITGLVESLIDGATGELPETTKANLKMVAASGRRLTTLVNDILDFSKLKHHGPRLDLKPVDLRTLVDMVLVLLSSLVSSKDLELRNAVAPDLPLALADEDRLLQILHNLVGNAIKFTEAGQVEITATERDDRLVVNVRDTGIGIPEDQQERIFHAFAQGDGTTEREFGGTGLGLASSRQLVQLHGGTLGVESTPGEGSTFFFDLPAAEEEMPADDVSAGQPTPRSGPHAEAPPSIEPGDGRPLAAEPQRGSASILVVDDELINRQLLVNQLTAAGYHVTQAASGPEALRRVEQQLPDLVLLDVMMPRMSGYEVCRILRQAHPIERLPILFLSAKDQSDDRIVGLDHGGNDYLNKPITKGELLSRVHTHLELLEAHRQQEREVVSLRGLLPICVRCKKIRDDEGFWNQMESYISRHSEAEFSHGICPTCTEELYPGLLDSE